MCPWHVLKAFQAQRVSFQPFCQSSTVYHPEPRPSAPHTPRQVCPPSDRTTGAMTIDWPVKCILRATKGGGVRERRVLSAGFVWLICRLCRPLPVVCAALAHSWPPFVCVCVSQDKYQLPPATAPATLKWGQRCHRSPDSPQTHLWHSPLNTRISSTTHVTFNLR